MYRNMYKDTQLNEKVLRREQKLKRTIHFHNLFDDDDDDLRGDDDDDRCDDYDDDHDPCDRRDGGYYYENLDSFDFNLFIVLRKIKYSRIRRKFKANEAK